MRQAAKTDGESHDLLFRLQWLRWAALASNNCKHNNYVLSSSKTLNTFKHFIRKVFLALSNTTKHVTLITLISSFQNTPPKAQFAYYYIPVTLWNAVKRYGVTDVSQQPLGVLYMYFERGHIHVTFDYPPTFPTFPYKPNSNPRNPKNSTHTKKPPPKQWNILTRPCITLPVYRYGLKH